jgi:monothiol glutaredoxin
MSFLKSASGLLAKQTRLLLQPAVVPRQFQAALSDAKSIRDRIDSMVKNDDVVVFMKGTPSSPSCGFSRAVVQILNMHGVNFDAHNILEDQELRSGIKEYSNWPTIPQIYFKGD